MKNNRNNKSQGRDRLLSEEERHRRLWLQYALQTPMPLPRYNNFPSGNNKNKPHGTSS